MKDMIPTQIKNTLKSALQNFTSDVYLYLTVVSFAKALFPIEVAVEGTTISCNDEQSLKA